MPRRTLVTDSLRVSLTLQFLDPCLGLVERCLFVGDCDIRIGVLDW